MAEIAPQDGPITRGSIACDARGGIQTEPRELAELQEQQQQLDALCRLALRPRRLVARRSLPQPAAER